MQPLMQALLICTTLVLVLPAQGAPLGTVFHANVTVFSTNALVLNLMPAIQSTLLLHPRPVQELPDLTVLLCGVVLCWVAFKIVIAFIS